VAGWRLPFGEKHRGIICKTEALARTSVLLTKRQTPARTARSQRSGSNRGSRGVTYQSGYVVLRIISFGKSRLFASGPAGDLHTGQPLCSCLKGCSWRAFGAGCGESRSVQRSHSDLLHSAFCVLSFRSRRAQRQESRRLASGNDPTARAG
jgi:hypothetical protein